MFDLKNFRKENKLTQKELSEYLDVSQGFISQVEQGVRPMPEEYINKIMEDGQFTISTSPKWNEVIPVPEGNYMMVEYVDLRASAGMLGVADITQVPETHIRLIPREFDNGKFLVVRVDGDSMDDGSKRSLSDGDEVLISLNENGLDSSLPIMKTLFVITTRDGNVLKQIAEINREEGYLLCRSFNPRYKDFKIHLMDIFQIFTVCKVVNRQISLI